MPPNARGRATCLGDRVGAGSAARLDAGRRRRGVTVGCAAVLLAGLVLFASAGRAAGGKAVMGDYETERDDGWLEAADITVPPVGFVNESYTDEDQSNLLYTNDTNLTMSVEEWMSESEAFRALSDMLDDREEEAVVNETATEKSYKAVESFIEEEERDEATKVEDQNMGISTEIRGVVFPDGPVGERGPTGPDGTDGEDGRAGNPGIKGAPGRMGEVGKQGGQGAPGVEGARGKRGFTGIRGLPGGEGPNGTLGTDGGEGNVVSWQASRYQCPTAETDTMRLAACSSRGCRLEVVFEGTWGTVCSQGFAEGNADILCKAFGFLGGGTTVRNFGKGSGKIWLEDVKCAADAGDVGDCAHEPWGSGVCSHMQDVGLCCIGEPPEGTLGKRTGPSSFPRCPAAEVGDLRLMDCNKEVCRVEIKHAGKWGTVCDNGFTQTNAETVCSIMGFREAKFKQDCATNGDLAGCAPNVKGTGPIWLDDLFCFGYETALDGCRHNPWGKNKCDHSQDVGVCCKGKKDIPTLPPVEERPLELDYIFKTSVQAKSITGGLVKLSGGKTVQRLKELEYTLKKGVAGFTSTTGGPELSPLFGGNLESSGFHFVPGAALGMDPYGYVNPEAYSVYMKVYLDDTSGWRNLVHSNGWKQDGLYVNNNLMLSPQGVEIQCRETILPSKWYQYVMTRAKSGKISLYINGGLCAEGTPDEASGYKDFMVLNPYSIEFMADFAGKNGEGYVSHIRIFNKTLDEEEVAKACSCTLPHRGEQCENQIVIGAVPLATEYSSHFGEVNGMLNSQSGWITSTNKYGQYMQFDTGQVQSVIGVSTQGHRTQNKWVKSFQVKVSKDGNEWLWVECGSIFDSNTDRNSRVRSIFHEPIFARYIRIYPVSWEGAIGLRAGAIVCERPCLSPAHVLDYDFQLSLVSRTLGPPLQAQWGFGDFYEDTGGDGKYSYKFAEGQGLELQMERCINNTDSWTIYMWMKIDTTTGFRRIITSRGWADYGLYVNKYLQMVPAGAHMQCPEPLRPDRWYKFYMTRDDEGLLKMYLHGAVCAVGSPPYKDHYQLNHGSLIFFKDDGDENTGGAVRRIKVWPRTLTEDEIEAREECKQPRRGLPCPFTVVYNAPLHRTVYSTIKGGAAPGAGLGRGRINSKQAWCPAANSNAQFMQVDLGFMQNVSGIVTQGRRDEDYWVTSYTVKASEDGITWTDVGCGGDIEGNTNRGNKMRHEFAKPILAKFLRIHPQTWHGAACMRMGVLLCEGPCVEGQLSYTFESTFASETAGPSLMPAWGDGAFDTNGYSFKDGVGFELDSRRCTNQTKEYTMMMEMQLSNVEREQILFTMDGWDEGGLGVKNWLQLSPTGANMVCEGTRLKPDTLYKVGITRTEEGDITLYLNGAECAAGNPPFFNNYQLNPKRILFLHDDFDKTNPAGVIRSLKLWDRALTREEIASEAECALPAVGSACTNNLALNAIYDRISYSSVQGGAEPGDGLGTGRLNSLQGWAPASSKVGEWMQIDTGEVQSVVGVVTQGRRDAEMWVKEYSVHSSIDGQEWHQVQCGRSFKANADKNSRVKVVFRVPIKARYIRILPEAWKSSIGLRAGVLVCERDCTDGQLHYEFTKGTFMSSTQGPAIDAPWGDGTFSTTLGWKFAGGEGLDLDQDEEGCMNNHVPKPATLNTAYSIFIDMQLSSVGGGWQRIIGSKGWGDTGLYVNENLMIYPPSAGIKCREKLVPNRLYKIGMTRSLDGEVTLYMNGAMCAHGTPLFNKGFTLDQHNVDFFHDTGSEHASGYVAQIHVWNKVLSEAEVANMAGCTLSLKAKSCSRNIIYSPSSANFIYSSIKDGGSPGSGLGRGRLNSAQAWAAGQSNGNEYAQIDIGEVGSISGVVLQGRRDAANWVKSFTVLVSSNMQSWAPVMCGMRFEGSTDQNTKTKIVFRESVRGRYVRVIPTAWQGWPAMRLGILVCEKPCEEGMLDYKFETSLLSDTEGPSADAAWGEGTFDAVRGYTFAAGQGLVVDASTCVVHPEEWTILIEASISNAAGGWRELLGSNNWGNYGIYVNDKFQLYPEGTGLMCLEKIKSNHWYSFVISRDETKLVKLYLNGYLCAEGSPPYVDAFLPDITDLRFFRSKGSVGADSGGRVRHIQIWNQALSDSAVAAACQCTLSPAAKACENVIMYNPPYARHSALRNKYNNALGGTCNAARLHSPSAWCDSGTNGWMQIDTGRKQTIEGVVTQGRRDANEWTTGFKVMLSSDGNTWTDVQCGSVFPGNKDRVTIVRTKFDTPLTARYIRIFPTQWYGSAASMRAGVLVCQQDCIAGMLEYKLQDSLATGDQPLPPLPPPAPVVASLAGGVCKDYAVHARAAVTFAGPQSTINGGDLAVSPGTSITGNYKLNGGKVISTPDSLVFAGSVVKSHAEFMRKRSNGHSMAIEMGGKTFTPGTYRSGSAINFAYGTVVTLDGLDQANPTFLFQAMSTLITAADTKFILKNGARAENVVWALGTAATLGARSVVEGSILAGSAITFGTKSELHGCALAQTAITFETAGIVSVPIPPPPPPPPPPPAPKKTGEVARKEDGGPNLRAPWGLSVYSRQNGYRVEEGQGFLLENAGSCLKATDWTVLMKLRVDNPSGDNRVFSSKGWGEFGWFVRNEKFTLDPELSMMTCAEKVYPNVEYQFAVTRDTEGAVKMFMNGFMCADGEPLQVDGYAIDTDQITFLHDDHSPFSGFVSKITVVEKAMSEQEVAADAGCTLLPASSDKCAATRVVTSNRAGTTASTFHDDYHYYAAIDSRRSWCARSNNKEQWLSVDTGSVQTIVGVVTQGRQDSDQWVSAYRVQVSNDNTNWTPVECDRVFQGNSERYQRVENEFSVPIMARYVRVNPYSWVNHISMRMGVLVCETPCTEIGGVLALSYDLSETLDSSTGGPPLYAPWGIGSFSSLGYRIGAGQGLRLDEENCFNPKVTEDGWTLITKATLDTVSGYRRIFNSGGWGDYGAYVYYGTYMLYPWGTNMACTDFPIRAGETVTYGLSRSAKGEVTMTLNGIECAKQKPPYLGRFQLDPQDISFFKDDGGENSAGTITSIAAFAAVLSEPDIQSKAGCVESFTVSHTKCSSRVYQVPYPDMTFSCSWANDAAGYRYGQGQLNSNDAFVACSGNDYIQLDSGKVQIITGTIIQGRHAGNQYVTAFKVSVSDDGQNWDFLRCDLSFLGSTNWWEWFTRPFAEPVVARYVRVYPTQWHNHPSFRMALTLCSEPCQGQALTYDFNGNLESSSKGVALDAQWGGGSYSGEWYRFGSGAGFMVDVSGCLKSDETYTVVVKAYFSYAASWNRILDSEGWRNAGLFVKDNKFGLLPGDLGVACETYIYSGQEYYFSMTREEDGTIRLGLNGYTCASALPEGAPAGGLKLMREVVSFFHDDDGHHSSGGVSLIALRGEALTDGAIQGITGCTPAVEVEKNCKSLVTFNVPYSGHSYSSVYAGDRIGTRYGRGRLDSGESLIFPNGNSGNWMQLDSGKVQSIAGLVVQGRSNANQYVTSFTLEASTDGKKWASVECGRRFTGNTDATSKLRVEFKKAISARYLKISVSTFYSHPCIRAALLVCESPCTTGELDYEFDSTFASSTGGPNLEAAWGVGSYDVGSKTYRFQNDKGLQVDESSCVKDGEEYSVYMDVRFNDVSNQRAIFTSEKWYENGLYAVDGFLSMKPSPLVCHGEKLRNGIWYKIGLTRDKDTKTVSLYLNGYLCATGTPRTKKGFTLDPTNLIFFRGPNSMSSSGEVRQIRVWDNALSDAEMLELAGCTLPQTVPRCSEMVTIVPNYAQFSASSIHQSTWPREMGNNYWGRPRLGDTYGWIPYSGYYRAGEWLQMDLLSLTSVAGVVTQGRSEAGWWITRFRVSVSEDGSNFDWVECGRMFTGNVNNDDELQTMFDLPVKARYVRIVIETWHGGPALRAGALTCQEKCQAQHLDYKTNLGLTSSTGGPGLIEEWGHETTSVSSGYRASAGKGLFLDARSCLSDPDSWTVIVQASLDTMRPKAGLMSAESWGDAGMYVVDEHYSMFPSEKLKCQELIRVGRNYWFAAVRDGKTNNVTVFLNGYECASAPSFAGDGFKLSEAEMSFMRRPTNDETRGYVKRIKVWGKALTAVQVRAESGNCQLPEEGQSCKSTIQWVPLYKDYKASSIHQQSGSRPGVMGEAAWGLPHLHEHYGWIPDHHYYSRVGQWLEMKLSETKTIAGVATQGRGDAGWWIKSYTVSVSNNGEDFTPVECGRIFEGNRDYNSVVERFFTRPVKAKYLRIYPQTWNGAQAMRAAVLLCESSCLDGHTDYVLTDSYNSMTGGPPVTPTWGQARSPFSSAGWRFGRGQGLEMDEDNCVKDRKAYSILMDVKLDSVDNAALVSTPAWLDSGLFVYDKKLQLRPSMSCSEKISTGYYYKFGMTRFLDGKVTIYVNGYPCATGSPSSANGFELKSHVVEFFHSTQEDAMRSGYVKRIQVWDDAQSDKNMAKMAECTLPTQIPEAQCIGEVVYIPPIDKFSASSVIGNFAMGAHYHSRPQLDSGYQDGWIPAHNRVGEWLQMDLGEVRKVKGVVTQGRDSVWQHVYTYRVKVSEEGTEWTDVECSRIFDGNPNYYQKVTNYFDLPVKARYVRFYPETWNGYPAMRVAAVVCEQGCDKGHLDYDLQVGLASVTGGPSLEATWGMRSRPFNSNGYRFGAGQGLEVVHSTCLESQKSYSLLMDVRLDTVHTNAGLFRFPSWGANGLYVSNYKLTLKGPSPSLECAEKLYSGEYYKFGITRDAKTTPATISLYINGFRCGSWKPAASDNFKLTADQMIFLRGESGDSSAGYVKRVQVWDHVLSEANMIEQAGVPEPTFSDKGCPGGATVEYNPDLADYTASSFYDSLGGYHGHPEINSVRAWIPNPNTGSWLGMKLAKVSTVAGIATQGRRDYPQWAQTFWISVSLDEEEWTWIEGKRIFPGQTNQNTVVKSMFTRPVKARYIRIYPRTWYNGWAALRAGAVLCEAGCVDSHLSYPLTSTMSSITGGPSLEQPWGAGSFRASDRPEHYYAVSENRGFQLNASSCFSDGETYSVLVNFRADKVHGTRALLDSASWLKSTGLMIKDSKLTLAPTDIVCPELIRTDYFYKFGLTRGDDKTVSLYLNGALCASGKPFQNVAFALDSSDLTFVRGDDGQSSGGRVVSIDVWGKALTSTAMAKASGCAMPTLASEACGVEPLLFLPEYSKITASSVYSNNIIGVDRYHALPHLHSNNAWVAAHNRQGEWLQLDLGKVRSIAGVVTQGRADANQWVQSYWLEVSDTAADGSWVRLECNRVFEANSDKTSEVRHMFALPVKAQFIRFVVRSWYQYQAMRVGALLCEKEQACDKLHLDYKMQDMTSATGGPAIEAPWGADKFWPVATFDDVNFGGNNFGRQQLDEKACLAACEAMEGCVGVVMRESTPSCWPKYRMDSSSQRRYTDLKSVYMTDKLWYQTSAEYGALVRKGEGFMVPYSACFAKRGTFSIVLDARLDVTTGMRRLINAGWRERGLYVRNERFMMFPTPSGLACDTPIKNELAYQFGITRSDKGLVSLYLNGWKCASGFPSYANGFALNHLEDGLDVLHDGDSSYETGGFVRRMQMWGDTLDDDAMAEASGCHLPTPAKDDTCGAEVTFGSKNDLTGSSILREDENLHPDHFLLSSNGKFRMSVKICENGRPGMSIEVYSSSRKTWSAHKEMTERDTRRCGAINKVTMQSNGNLVVWGTRDWCWHANTNYHGFTPQMVLTMQSDGNLVMYDRRGRVAWASGSNVEVAGAKTPPLDPYDAVTFSDVMNNDEKGQYYGRGLGVLAPWCWRPKSNCQDFNSWMQIDLGEKRTVTKVRTAGQDGWGVTSFFLKVSDDGTVWKDVECNRRFYTPWSGSNTVHTTAFTPPLTAQFVRLYPSEYVNGPRLRMEVAYCTKAGFTSKKSPLARLHLLPSAAFGKGGSRASRGAAGAVVLARAAAKAKKGQSRVDPCGGEPAGCNPCQERAPFPGQLGPCRNDVRCFTPAKPGNKGGKAGLAALAAAAWRAAEGVVAKATGGGRQGGGGGECRPALCAAGDAACYATALAEPKAGGYPAVDSPEFSCALYDDALFRPAEGVALRRKCKGDARCKHEACGCIELGDRCVHGAEAPGRARASLPSEDTEPDTPVRSTADRGGLGEGRGGAGGVVDAHASPEAYVA